MSATARTKVIIMGAGFAGTHVARELSRRLPKEEGQIILIDQNNYSLFTPLLTEVVGGQVDTRHVINAVRTLAPRVHVEQGRVDSIDLAAKRVTITTGGLENGIPGHQRTLAAEHLVIALGSVTNFHDIPGVREHALTVKSVGDAAAIRNRALALLEAADMEPDAAARRLLLTFVVGGGGFSGVETMAALNDFVRDAATHYPRITADQMRTVLVHPGKQLLPELSSALASYAQQKLRQRGVEIHLNTKIGGAGPDYVELEGGQRIATRLLIWAAGVMPSPVIGALDCQRGDHGGIVVDACCRVPDHPGVWALGDCAEVPQPGGQKSYAPTAQNATREGALVARNIVAAMRGQKPRPFVYKPVGELAIVGSRSGVARIYGLHLSGVVAWVLWRGVYLAKMPRMSKRVRVGLDWLLDLLFDREIAAAPGARSPVGQTEDRAER